jgi:3-hydroxymyristoyl/3-hydroxydecanoyl-(acyl carrier protein) dehydratase
VRFIDTIRVDLRASSGEASLQVDADADYLKGHFPGAPTLPGLVMLEAAVQTAAAVWRAGSPASHNAVLSHVDYLSVSRRVVPGEVLVVKVRLRDVSAAGAARFDAEGSVASDTAMRARFRLETGLSRIGASCGSQ